MEENNRISKEGLMDRLISWDGYLKKKVHLVACGGTAMTLLGVKASTKDIDFIIPDDDEYRYLLGILSDLGYVLVKGGVGWQRPDDFTFDLFAGKYIHTTELLESPLEDGNHHPIREFEHIELSVLNYYDIIISKLFRGSDVDYSDCLELLRQKRNEIDMGKLEARYKETASYDVSEKRNLENWDIFIKLAKEKGLIT